MVPVVDFNFFSPPLELSVLVVATEFRSCFSGIIVHGTNEIMPKRTLSTYTCILLAESFIFQCTFNKNTKLQK